jgi:hypothetical protein
VLSALQTRAQAPVFREDALSPAKASSKKDGDFDEAIGMSEGVAELVSAIKHTHTQGVFTLEEASALNKEFVDLARARAKAKKSKSNDADAGPLMLDRKVGTAPSMPVVAHYHPNWSIFFMTAARSRLCRLVNMSFRGLELPMTRSSIASSTSGTPITTEVACT